MNYQDPTKSATPAPGSARLGDYADDDGDIADTASSEAATIRAAMVRKLCDIVVLPAARISSNERSLAADFLLEVLDKVELELRIEVATRVARVSEAPPPLIRMLLLDEPQVAEPIIRKADHVASALLIEAARNGETAHRDMIARRLDLTASVADVLLEYGELDVAKLLLRREEFVFSPHAIDYLVARTVADPEMQMLLLRRRELEPAHGFMMFWWVDGERRKRILSRFAMDRSIIQDTLQDLYPRVYRHDGADSDPFVKDILTKLDRRHRPRGVNGDPISMDVVIKTLMASRRYPSQEVIHAVGMIAGISRELAARLLRDPGGEPFAVMCKSLGMPRASFFEIMSDPKGENPLDEQRAEDLLEVFDSMARDFSRAVLRYWDWDGNPRIAYITRLLGIDID